MTTIPFDFSGNVEEHLIFERIGDLHKVTWPLLTLTVFHESDAFPEHEDMMKHTPDLTFHGYNGYSLGQFHEFFIDYIPTSIAFGLGTAQVTFGNATPLAAHVYGIHQNEDVHGDWSIINTVRIQGASTEHSEVVLLNALRRYADQVDVQPRIIEVGPVSWISDELFDSQIKLPKDADPVAVPRDIEPLRCFYYASVNADYASSCIQYYRVLEYYAFFGLTTKLSELRRDTTLSDRDFLVSVGQLLSRDERGPIIQLVTRLADPSLIKLAADSGLIATPNGQALGAALYDFRNAIVHAKYDQRSALVVDPVIGLSGVTKAWRLLLEKLAKAALHVCSSKLRL